MAIKPIFKNNSIFLLCNPYWLQIKDKIHNEGIYEESPTLKESKKIPIQIAATKDLQGEFLSENGNNKITGQHGEIPFSFSQTGDIIMHDCRQIIVKKINNFLLFLTIIFQDLNPIYCIR